MFEGNGFVWHRDEPTERTRFDIQCDRVAQSMKSYEEGLVTLNEARIAAGLPSLGDKGNRMFGQVTPSYIPTGIESLQCDRIVVDHWKVTPSYIPTGIESPINALSAVVASILVTTPPFPCGMVCLPDFYEQLRSEVISDINSAPGEFFVPIFGIKIFKRNQLTAPGEPPVVEEPFRYFYSDEELQNFLRLVPHS